MPSSIEEIGYIWNFPSSTAFIISSLRFKFLTFWIGIITPFSPFKPLDLHTLKKPSILSVTPPTGWISPFWFTEPVTARLCFIGIPERLDNIA